VNSGYCGRHLVRAEDGTETKEALRKDWERGEAPQARGYTKEPRRVRRGSCRVDPSKDHVRDFLKLYRCQLSKYDNPSKLSIKEPGDFRRRGRQDKSSRPYTSVTLVPRIIMMPLQTYQYLPQ
jgi:hypothetical protein